MGSGKDKFRVQGGCKQERARVDLYIQQVGFSCLFTKIDVQRRIIKGKALQVKQERSAGTKAKTRKQESAFNAYQ